MGKSDCAVPNCEPTSTPYDTPLTEPSTSFGQTTTSRRGLLHGMGIFKTSELTPKAKRMYRQAIYYKRRAHALNRKNFKEKQFSNYIKECIEQSKRREFIIEEDYNCEATEADRFHIHWIHIQMLKPLELAALSYVAGYIAKVK
ncbi:hypothetical protein NQ317_002529 [Molorchus minor]|uniref:Uncharacterized protein n=2 Tax=Molorchus minor TaxID=1323400 RepID=A0ABQ9IV18_9CUCU|nr:hypothetical protein NQ317_002529 [Molorchus minor]